MLIRPGGSGLFLDPGMGKTICALMAFEHLRKTGRAKKMLVIAPLGPAYTTWVTEPRKWDQTRHLMTKVLHGKNKENFLFDPSPIHVVNYEGLQWLYQHELLSAYDVLCADESTRLKHPQRSRFKALKPNLADFEWRWCLTGTMAPNGLIDMFGQSYVMDTGIALGKFITHYRNKFFMQSGYGGYTWEPKDDALGQIGAKLAGHCLRLNAEDYLDMPLLKQIERPVFLPPAAASLYRAVERDYFAKLADGVIIAANKAVAGIKCRQIANGAVYDDEGETIDVHDAKMEELASIVEETNGLPLMVMYEFQHDRKRLEQFFKKKAVCVTGLKGKRLADVVARFNSGKIGALLCHPGTVAGMNIQQACHHIVWFSIPWNLEHYIQSNWRLYRQGQPSKIVLCYHLTAQGTLDERVASVLSVKKTTQSLLEAAVSLPGETDVET